MLDLERGKEGKGGSEVSYFHFDRQTDGRAD